MPLFNFVLRKYTPPTCTLEIKARESPLSRWVKLPVLKQLQFKLSFDDPRQSEEQRITIWGDGAELEALCEVVETYVQNFIDQSPNQLPEVILPATANNRMPTVAPDLGNGYDARTLLESRVNSYEPVAEDEQPIEEVEPENSPNQERHTLGMGMLPPTIYLQPRGLLAHDLFLGPLATGESGPVITLTVLQLFDLATALDEYAAEMVALPKLTPTRRPLALPFNLSSRPVFAYTAAAGLVAAVGLAAVVIKLSSQPSTKVAVVVPTQQPTSLEPTPYAGDVSSLPNTSQVPNSVVPSPLPTSPGANSLPTSPGANSLANSPAPNSLQTLPGANSLGSPPSVISSQQLPSSSPTRSQASSRSNSSPASIPRAYQSQPVFPTQTDPSFSVTPKVRSSPRPQPRVATAKKLAQRVAVAPPRTASRVTPPKKTQTSSSPVASAPLPKKSPLIPPSPNRSSRGVQGQNRTLPQLNPSPAIPPLAALPPLEAPSPLIESPPSITANSDPLNSGVGDNLAAQERTGADTTTAAKTRLFDTIPQVAEARNYFQTRWKPPQGLTQNLQYSVTLGVDGSIDRIIPLTDASKTYVDRSGMPRLGEPFVSPVQGANNPKIRVVLDSDGNVETFLE